MEKDVRGLERDADEIENQIRNAIRKRRNDKRKECQDELDRTKKCMSVLTDNFEEAEVKLDSMSRDVQNLKKQQTYVDLERNKDI